MLCRGKSSVFDEAVLTASHAVAESEPPIAPAGEEECHGHAIADQLGEVEAAGIAAGSGAGPPVAGGEDSDDNDSRACTKTKTCARRSTSEKNMTVNILS